MSLLRRPVPLISRCVQCLSRQYHLQSPVTVLSITSKGPHDTQKRTIFNSKKDVSRQWIATLQQEIDLRPVSIRRWKKRVDWNYVELEHRYNGERVGVLGEDLAIAHFVIGRGGAVRFCGTDHWFEATKKREVPDEIPNCYEETFKIEAIDASGTNMMYTSFDNIAPVTTLRYMNLSNCAHIDDWCLDRFHLYRDCLEYLDISGCPKITERGLATLHKMRGLKRLRIDDLSGVRDKQLVSLMLEESMPNCLIEGMDFTIPEEVTESSVKRETFEDYERHLIALLDADMKGKAYDPALHIDKLS